MALLQLKENPTFTLDVTAHESDVYTGLAYVKFERNMISQEVEEIGEMFMTPDHLELLGRFLLRQADEIRAAQFHRYVTLK